MGPKGDEMDGTKSNGAGGADVGVPTLVRTVDLSGMYRAGAPTVERRRAITDRIPAGDMALEATCALAAGQDVEMQLYRAVGTGEAAYLLIVDDGSGVPRGGWCSAPGAVTEWGDVREVRGRRMLVLDRRDDDGGAIVAWVEVDAR